MLALRFFFDEQYRTKPLVWCRVRDNMIKYIAYLTIILCFSMGCQEADAPFADKRFQTEALLTSDQQEQGSENQITEKQARKIIKEAEMGISVEEYSSAVAAIDSLTRRYEGYISKEQERRGDTYTSNELLIRVPNEHFESLMEDISQIAKKVTFKQIEAKDVTEQFVDVQARLKSKRVLEDRYRSLLAKAQKVEELLKVEQQLGIIREEIEATEGRLRYLQDQVAYSSIKLHVRMEKENPASSFFFRVVHAFRGGWEGLVNMSIGIIYLWPFILLGGLWIFFIKQTNRNFWGKKKFP